MKTTLSLLIVFSLTSCSLLSIFTVEPPSQEPSSPVEQQSTSLTEAPPVTPSASISEVELLLARASLAATDFEHYRLSGTTLISECGQIKHGRHIIREQHIDRVPADASSELSALVPVLASADRTQLPPPGDLGAFYDPGQLKLTIGTQGESALKIITSVDAIAPAKSEVAETLASLIERIRGIRPPICGQPRFYGIERQETKR